MTLTISYQQQRFMVTKLSWSSLLMRIYGGIDLPSPFHILVRVKKCHHKLICDGQKSLYHQKLIIAIPYRYQGMMGSNHQPLACKVGALALR